MPVVSRVQSPVVCAREAPRQHAHDGSKPVRQSLLCSSPDCSAARALAALQHQVHVCISAIYAVSEGVPRGDRPRRAGGQAAGHGAERCQRGGAVGTFGSGRFLSCRAATQTSCMRVHRPAALQARTVMMCLSCQVHAEEAPASKRNHQGLAPASVSAERE